MPKSISSESITNLQKIILTISTLSLIIILLFLRGNLNSQAPLNQLAEKSMEPMQAINNEKPTVFEFYADWCEVCKKMAPSMFNIEKNYSDRVNFVLLNVDNPRWGELIDKYEVNGVPQLTFLDKDAKVIYVSKGLQSEEQINKSINYLLNERIPSKNITNNNQNSIQSNIKLAIKNNQDSIKPRSHG
ncbi:thioredoxin domain-containing protein [Prochlorococcus sp. MIT 1223]|uniref:thioredoxin domain-containing protein n=1 Tax=Prochlorococcus sp. MIT 1223 TaxID=3096217 RepID=UPI002A748072|nr:thioredoxin domain-containing protein [Prochlorococcus sp. MIT 1223]